MTLRERMAETQSTRLELARHFFRRFFDSDFVSTPGQLRVVAGGAAAVLLSSSILFIVAYYHKYMGLNTLDDPVPFHLAALSDILFVITLSMAVTGLLTVLQWTSLFPGLRDYLALAALPFRPRDLFIAKFSALVLFAVSLILATTVLPSILLPILQEGKYSTHGILHIIGLFFGSTAGCLFLFFSLVALQGVLLNVLPSRLFQRVSLTLQGILLIGLLCTVPLVFSIPNLQPSMVLRPDWILYVPMFWFVGIEQVVSGSQEYLAFQLALVGIVSPVVAALFATATYLWSYRRHRVRVLESPSVARTTEPVDWLRFIISDPRDLAVTDFIIKTLTRSREHRLILSAFTALALAVIAEMFLTLRGAPKAAISIPLALSLFVICGFFYLFRLPVELRANWVFRVNEQGNRLLFLRAAERFLAVCAVGLTALIALPAEMVLLGPLRGAAVGLLCVMPALVLLETLLFRFDQVPFTSTYLPGQRPVIETLVIYGVGVAVYVSLLAGAIAWLIKNPLAACIFFVTMAALLFWIRHARRDQWAIGKLQFEELPEPAIQTLGIDRD